MFVEYPAYTPSSTSTMYALANGVRQAFSKVPRLLSPVSSLAFIVPCQIVPSNCLRRSTKVTFHGHGGLTIIILDTLQIRDISTQ